MGIRLVKIQAGWELCIVAIGLGNGKTEKWRRLVSAFACVKGRKMFENSRGRGQVIYLRGRDGVPTHDRMRKPP